jgi:hypothetical protein
MSRAEKDVIIKKIRESSPSGISEKTALELELFSVLEN